MLDLADPNRPSSPDLSQPIRIPSTARRDSKSCWSPDGSNPFESVLMVAPADSPVFPGDAVDECSGCGGYYLDSNGQPVYTVDYVRYWDCWLVYLCQSTRMASCIEIHVFSSIAVNTQYPDILI